MTSILSAISPSTSFADYGALGLVVLACFSAIAWLAKTLIARESQRGDRFEQMEREANQRLLSVLTEKVIPALSDSSAAVKESTDLQQRVHDLLERLLEAQRGRP